MLLGDVLVVVASIVALGVSAWALFLAAAFLFRIRTERAQRAVESGPGRCFWLGLFATTVWTIFALRLFEIPVPLAKLLSIAMFGGLVLLIGVGGGGIARIISRRIQDEDPSISPLPALVRGSLYLVLASAMPAIGTLIITPVVISISVGAAIKTAFARQTAAVPTNI